jgi:hypothetical protein
MSLHQVRLLELEARIDTITHAIEKVAGGIRNIGRPFVCRELSKPVSRSFDNDKILIWASCSSTFSNAAPRPTNKCGATLRYDVCGPIDPFNNSSSIAAEVHCPGD